MSKNLLYVLCVLSICGNQARALAPETPVHNPSGVGDAVPFDWQEKWGTIHMNSFADGLRDPGAQTTGNGKIACPLPLTSSVLCKDATGLDKLNSLDKNIDNASITNHKTLYRMVAGKKVYDVIDNGIKFDIKNSVLNCMAKPHPNFPSENGYWNHPYSQPRCQTLGLNSRYDISHAALIYTPIWDPRGNDERAFVGTSAPAGCVQQMINNCVEDLHDCRPRHTSSSHPEYTSSDTAAMNRVPGYTQPVTHVFTEQEVADLGGVGQALPLRYYAYTRGVEFHAAEDVDTADLASKGKYVLVDTSTLSPALAPGVVRIKRIKNNKTRIALSRVETIPLSGEEVLENGVPSTPVTTINNTGDPNLARIQSYAVNDLKILSDITGFVIVDPKDFFNLYDYIKGGRFDSGYDKFVKEGDPTSEVKTYDSCPILGLKFGYGGICDPTKANPAKGIENAGCNLPVYGIGPQTTFTTEGSTFVYNDYPIKWSGYVKKWAVITKDQYLENVKGRRGVNGGQLYATAEADVNDGPVLMLTRATSYCDAMERYLGLDAKGKQVYSPHCIQYKQYQDYGTPGAPKYGFVDLFQPEEDPGPVAKFAFSTLVTFNQKNSQPNSTSPLAGNNESGGFLAGAFAKPAPFKHVSFLETTLPQFTNTITGIDGKNKVEKFAALKREDYVTSPIRNIAGEPTIGEYIQIDPKDAEYFGSDPTSYGTSLKLQKGKAFAFRLPDTKEGGNKENGDYILGGKPSTRCTIVVAPPKLPEIMEKNEMFIPTNSQEELDAFLNTAWNQDSKITSTDTLMVQNGFNAKNCTAKYMTYAQLNDPGKPPANANGTKTWIGRTSCAQLTQKPSCNQTQIITAQRYCMLEDGIQGQCDECKNVLDPDANVDFSLKKVAPKGNAEILSSPQIGGSLCYFSAACFNDGSAAGCPAQGGSGGHVFCLSSDTLITLADGSKKEIVKLKSGDRVLAFKAESSNDKELATAEVMATAITQDQPVLRISYSYKEKGKSKEGSIRITPLHKMVLANGRALVAQDLRAGDQIVTASGAKATVEDVESEKSRITVYNLVLEDGFDGYIAGDLRVLSYPILKGMETTASAGN